LSTGHRLGGGRSSKLLVDRCLKDPEVRRLLYRYEHLDDGYDIPYLAGYSTDGKTIYIDRHLPEMLSYHHDGRQREYDPRRFLIDHESMEKALIDAFGWRYEHAHDVATAYERRHVLEAGLLWQPYQEAYRPYIKADEHERLKKVPAELDLTPYEDDPRLLHHLQKKMH
jgi:hypothetical protein